MFRRPNTTPLQTQHSSRQPTRVRCSGPKQSAGAEHSRHFLHQQTRFAQMLENLGRRYHVKVLRAKLSLLELTLKDFETEFSDMLGSLLCDFQTLRVPTVLARGEQKIARTTTNIKQTVLLAIA